MQLVGKAGTDVCNVSVEVPVCCLVLLLLLLLLLGNCMPEVRDGAEMVGVW